MRDEIVTILADLLASGIAFKLNPEKSDVIVVSEFGKSLDMATRARLRAIRAELVEYLRNEPAKTIYTLYVAKNLDTRVTPLDFGGEYFGIVAGSSDRRTYYKITPWTFIWFRSQIDEQFKNGKIGLGDANEVLATYEKLSAYIGANYYPHEIRFAENQSVQKLPATEKDIPFSPDWASQKTMLAALMTRGDITRGEL